MKVKIQSERPRWRKPSFYILVSLSYFFLSVTLLFLWESPEISAGGSTNQDAVVIQKQQSMEAFPKVIGYGQSVISLREEIDALKDEMAVLRVQLKNCIEVERAKYYEKGDRLKPALI